MEKKTYPLIYIEWCDAISFERHWISLNEAREWGSEKNWIIRQSGFVIDETSEYILLASSINPENGVSVDGLLKIPKTWIKKRTTLLRGKIISS